MSSEPPETLEIDAVIVNFNSGALLKGLLHSLERARKAAESSVRLSVTVVDNASQDDSCFLASAYGQNVRWLPLARNVGFGAAANLGARAGRAPWLLVLNSDVRLSEEFLGQLPAQLAGLSERVGIAGPTLLNEDGSHQPSVGRFPTLARTLAGLTRRRAQRKYVSRRRHRAGAVDWVTGACLLVRRSCWHELRGFDEAYFLYYEDIDLCRRARSAGAVTAHLPALSATHVAPTAQRELPAGLVPIVRRSQLRWFRLYRSTLEARALTALVRLWACWGAWLGRSDVDWQAVRDATDAAQP